MVVWRDDFVDGTRSALVTDSGSVLGGCDTVDAGGAPRVEGDAGGARLAVGLS